MSGSKLSSLYPDLLAVVSGGPGDLNVVRYVADIARRAESRRIVFVSLSLRGQPEEPRGEAALRSFIAGETGKRFANRVKIIDLDEDDLDGLLRVARDEKVDLLVIGRRLPSAQLARTSFYQSVVRKAPCDVLLVTPYHMPRYKRILVPVDFSEHAGMAAKAALALSSTEPAASATTCLHVSSIPYGFSYAAESEEAFAEHQEEAHRSQFTSFVLEHRLPRSRVECFFIPSEHPSRVVTEMAQATGTDLVVLGSRGRSSAASILLGSTTANLVGECAAPILVVKVKGETLGFLAALLQG